MEKQQYTGVWATRDGYIRHEFLPNGRYNESRGDLKNAFTGYYSVLRNHVEYLDDTGFTADGDFRNGIYYHAGMVLYKQTDDNSDQQIKTEFEDEKPAY